MSAYKVEYSAVWPGTTQSVLIEPTQDKQEFFAQFDLIINQLHAWGCPKNLRPRVQVRALEWTDWASYGDAQNRGWTSNE